MEIGRRIADARASAGMTQQQLAEKLFVSRDLVAKWEQGRRRPDHGTIVRIAEALSVKPESIISREEYAFRELRACIPENSGIPTERLSALISRFLRERPRTEADVFIRRYYLLQSNADVASFYGMGENRVRSMLSKTAKRLGKFLKEECENERL
ncbi:MAG: helix-turn-helix transcriptional regulator [Clostridia bacterium]|nr:helix-turn-helix transcriptional regulator [Clostridia bacterium]